MENLNLYKLKMFALAAAGLALIAVFLPWQTYSIQIAGFGGFGGRSGSVNGMRGWGWISLLGVIAVVIATFMGDKSRDYDETSKKVVLGGFAGIIAGAIIFMIRVMSVGNNAAIKSSPGFGLFICLVAGIAGIALVLGLVKIPDTNSPLPPSPPPPPKI